MDPKTPAPPRPPVYPHAPALQPPPAAGQRKRARVLEEEEEAAASASAAPALARGDGAVSVVARIFPATTAPPGPAPAAGTSLVQVAATRARRRRSFGPRAGAFFSITPAPAAAAPTPSSSSSQAAGQLEDDLRLDWCYLQNEDNLDIFRHELKPFITHHLTTTGSSSSSNACVVAYGAAAAKDHLFKGSQDQPGLVTIAMEKILDFAASIGGAVRVSSYQVVQDTHVFDLLQPKDQEVLLQKDAQGKTHLKGLSKVHVKSNEDFARLGCFDEKQQQQQPTTQLQTRGHQGLIIYVSSSSDQDGKERAVAKIDFLSLADCVDPEHNSISALMNVVKALNSNRSSVPYKQSKVTRILQDSLCNTSRAVVIACLEEVSCQDAVSTLRLAARSSQVANEQCRRPANVNLSAVAKSSSRPQWNMSTRKACPTPIANKRSQPNLHSAKKPESTVSPPTKRKKTNSKPAMSKRSQVMMCSAKKTLLSASIKTKQKDKPTTTSGSNSAKEEAAVIAQATQATVIEVEEVQSSQGMEIDAPSTDFGPKISDKLREIAKMLKDVNARSFSIITQEEGLERTTQEEGLERTTQEEGLERTTQEEGLEKAQGVAMIMRSTGQQLLSFLKSANEEDLKSLKGIAEKRVQHILLFRKERPDLFEERPELIEGIVDLLKHIGLHKGEIKKIMPRIIYSS